MAESWPEGVTVEPGSVGLLQLEVSLGPVPRKGTDQYYVKGFIGDTQVRTNLFTTTPSEDFDARFNLSIPSGYKTVTIQTFKEGAKTPVASDEKYLMDILTASPYSFPVAIDPTREITLTLSFITLDMGNSFRAGLAEARRRAQRKASKGGEDVVSMTSAESESSEDRAAREEQERAVRSAIREAELAAMEQARLEALEKARSAQTDPNFMDNLHSEETARKAMAERQAKRLEVMRQAEEAARRAAEEKAQREAEEREERIREAERRRVAMIKQRQEAEERARKEMEESKKWEQSAFDRVTAVERAKQYAEELATQLSNPGAEIAVPDVDDLPESESVGGDSVRGSKDENGGGGGFLRKLSKKMGSKKKKEEEEKAAAEKAAAAAEAKRKEREQHEAKLRQRDEALRMKSQAEREAAEKLAKAQAAIEEAKLLTRKESHIKGVKEVLSTQPTEVGRSVPLEELENIKVDPEGFNIEQRLEATQKRLKEQVVVARDHYKTVITVARKQRAQNRAKEEQAKLASLSGLDRDLYVERLEWEHALQTIDDELDKKRETMNTEKFAKENIHRKADIARRAEDKYKQQLTKVETAQRGEDAQIKDIDDRLAASIKQLHDKEAALNKATEDCRAALAKDIQATKDGKEERANARQRYIDDEKRAQQKKEHFKNVIEDGGNVYHPTTTLAKDIVLEKQSWYRPKFGKNEATAYLDLGDRGSFVVRDGGAGILALSIQCGEKASHRVAHVRLAPTTFKGKAYYQIGSTEQYFEHLYDLALYCHFQHFSFPNIDPNAQVPLSLVASAILEDRNSEIEDAERAAKFRADLLKLERESQGWTRDLKKNIDNLERKAQDARDKLYAEWREPRALRERLLKAAEENRDLTRDALDRFQKMANGDNKKMSKKQIAKRQDELVQEAKQRAADRQANGPQVHIYNDCIEVNEEIEFEGKSATIAKVSYTILDILARKLKESEAVLLEVAVHTNGGGENADRLKRFRQTQTEDRAEAIVKFLVSKGISPKQLFASGYGESKPLVPNDTEEQRALNRRIEFNLHM